LYVMGDDVVIVTFGFNDVQCWLILSCSWCWKCVIILFGWCELWSFEVCCISWCFWCNVDKTIEICIFSLVDCVGCLGYLGYRM
jgi:hypothetical protein